MAPIMQSAFARAFAPSPDLYAADEVHDGLDPAGDALQEEATSYERDMVYELFRACMDGNAQLVMDLINEGHGDLTSTDAAGQSLLHMACRGGHSAAVVALMRAGIDVQAPDQDGATALHVAAAHSEQCLEAIVQHLAAAPGQEDHGGPQMGSSPADSISQDNRSIRMMAALSARDDMGLTPLHYAARAGNCPAVRLLLSCGVDVLGLDASARTPASYAASHNQAAALQLLLACPGRGRPDALAMPDASGQLPLHAAAAQGHAGVLPLLTNAQVPPDRECVGSRRTALHLAAAGGHLQAVRVLLQQLGASPDVQDAMGTLPCHIAAEEGHLEVLQELLAAGATANVTDREGWAPLHLAANNGHAACVDALLASDGGPVDLPNAAPGPRCGWTALHCCTKQGNLAMVRHLLARGADPTAADGSGRKGWSPQHHAAADGAAEVLAALADADGAAAAAAADDGDAVPVGPPGWSGRGQQAAADLPEPAAAAAAAGAGAAEGAHTVEVDGGAAGATTAGAAPGSLVIHSDGGGGAAVSAARAAATQMVGHTPISLAVVRRQRRCVELLSRLACELRQAQERQAMLTGDGGGGDSGSGIGDWVKAGLEDQRRRRELARLAAAGGADGARNPGKPGDHQHAPDAEVCGGGLQATAPVAGMPAVCSRDAVAGAVGVGQHGAAAGREGGGGEAAALEGLSLDLHLPSDSSSAVLPNLMSSSGSLTSTSPQTTGGRSPGTADAAGPRAAYTGTTTAAAAAPAWPASEAAGTAQPLNSAASPGPGGCATHLEPRPIRSPFETPPPAPSAARSGRAYSGVFPSVPEEWEPLGVVLGLVQVGPDHVLRSSQSNSDVEAWLMYVGSPEEAKTDAGWGYFEVEVMEPGATGLFWLGWSTGLAFPHSHGGSGPQRFAKHSSSSPALTGGAGGSGAAAPSPLLGGGAASAAPSTPAGGANGGNFRAHSLALPSHTNAAATAAGGALSVAGSAGGPSPQGPLASRGAGSAALLSSDGGGSHSSSCHLGTSYVICSVDGHRVHLHGGMGHSSPFAPKLNKGDVIGLMHNRACCTISLTLNRKYLGICFSDIVEVGSGSGSHSSGSEAWAYSSMLPMTPATPHMDGVSGHFTGGAPAGQLHPVVGLKSGGAALRFIYTGFHKNLDSLLFTEEKLHNPHHHDPASSMPWRFKTGMHALHFCAACDNRWALSTLLARFPDAVDARDDDGWGPLAMACMHGNAECARMLLKAGANVNAVTCYGSTPIIFAVRYGHVDVVGLLIEHGANLRARDHNGRTLLMRAARSGNIPIIDQLLQRGVDLHARDKFGKTVLQFAKNDEVFRFLYNVESQDRLQPHLYDGPQVGMHRPSWSILPSDIEMEQWALGVGSFGAVFRAKWQGSQVAVKQLQKLTPETLQQFQDEVNVMVQLRHPNIIQFLGAITTTNSLRGPAIVTELAARGNLSEVMANTPMSDSQLFKMAADIARGMLYLHELKPRPIVHRDLKPGNCLVTADFSVKIADFGLSSVKHKEQFISTFQATPVYMAPELAEGNYDEKVDVYSFGCLLYEMVTGNAPWHNLTAPHQVLQVLYGPKPRRSLQAEIPTTGIDQGVRGLMAACLDPEPKLRPSFKQILRFIEELRQRRAQFRMKQRN